MILAPRKLSSVVPAVVDVQARSELCGVRGNR